MTDQSAGDWHNVHFATSVDRALETQADILQLAQKSGYSEDQVFAARLALEEAFVNAMKHGNQMDTSRQVHIKYQVTRDKMTVVVADEGEGFDPNKVPDPTMFDDDDPPPSGRGLLLIRHYMSDVSYNERGNEITMVLNRG